MTAIGVAVGVGFDMEPGSSGPPATDWILETGIWDDTKHWVDTDNWID